MQSLEEYLKYVSPNANIRIYNGVEVWEGCAGLYIEMCNIEPFNKMDVVGRMFLDGVLTIYVFMR